MAVDAAQIEPAAADQPAHRLQRAPALELEAEALPGGHRHLGHADANPHLRHDAELLGHLLGQDQLVEVIEVHPGAVAEGELQIRARLARTVEEDLLARHAEVQGLAQLEAGDDLGPGPLLVEDPADGVEVVGLVRPGDGEAGEPAGQLIAQIAITLPEHPLGEDEERRSVRRDQIGDGHTLDGLHGAHRGRAAELVGRAHGVADDHRTFVARFHCRPPASPVMP